MRKLLVFGLVLWASLALFDFANAQTVLFPRGGGTGVSTTVAGNIGKCLSVSSVGPLVYTFSSCAGGGGGGVNTSTANYFTYYGSATAVTGTPLMQLTDGTITFTSTTNFAGISATSVTSTNLFASNLELKGSTDPLNISSSTSGTSMFHVDTLGNVRIGTTTQGNNFFIVADPSGPNYSSTSTAGFTMAIAGASGKFPLVIVGGGPDSGTPSLIRFETASGNKGRIAVTAANTLGINAASGQKLNFGADGPTTIDLVVLQNHFVGIGTTTPLSWFAVQPQAGIHNIADFASSSGVSALRILANGYVGVNTGTPRANLAVEGSLLVNGPATSTNLSITAVTSCNASNQALQTDSIGGVTCGTLATGGGGSGAVNTSTANYFTYYLTGTSVTGTPLMQLTAGTVTFTSTTNFANIGATSVTSTNLYVSGTTKLNGNTLMTFKTVPSGAANAASLTLGSTVIIRAQGSDTDGNSVGEINIIGGDSTSGAAGTTALAGGNATGAGTDGGTTLVYGGSTADAGSAAGPVYITGGLNSGGGVGANVILRGGTGSTGGKIRFANTTDNNFYVDMSAESLSGAWNVLWPNQDGTLAVTTDIISNHAALSNLNWSAAGHTFDTLINGGGQILNNLATVSSTNALFINATTTNLFVSGATNLLKTDYPAVATSTFLAISASTSLAYLNYAYPAMATNTFISKTASTSFPNLTQVGTLANLVWTNATGTNVNITGLTNLANTTITNVSSTNLYASGLANLVGLSFGTAVGTSVTTTNLMIFGPLKDSAGSPGTAGMVLQNQGGTSTRWVTTSSLGIAGGGSTSPAGSNSYIQYNNNGAFGATSTFSLLTNASSETVLNLGTTTLGSIINAGSYLTIQATDSSQPQIVLDSTDPGIGISFAGTVASGTDGGVISFTSGAGNGTGAGGNLTFSSGEGGVNGNSGSFTFETGAGGSVSGNSGDFSIQTGSVIGGGIRGEINLSARNILLSTVLGTVTVDAGLSVIGIGATTTNLNVSGLTSFTNLNGTNATTTNLSFTRANGTSVTSTNGFFTTLGATNATFTSVTTTNLSVSSLSAIAGLTFTNATGTNANVSGLLSFGNANGTNVTSTNLYVNKANFLFKGFSIPSSSLAIAATTTHDLPPFPMPVTLNSLTCGTDSGSSTVQVGSSTLSVPVFASSTGTVLPEIAISVTLPAFTKWQARVGTILAAANMPTRYVFCTVKYSID